MALNKLSDLLKELIIWNWFLRQIPLKLSLKEKYWKKLRDLHVLLPVATERLDNCLVWSHDWQSILLNQIGKFVTTIFIQIKYVYHSPNGPVHSFKYIQIVHLQPGKVPEGFCSFSIQISKAVSILSTTRKMQHNTGTLITKDAASYTKRGAKIFQTIKWRRCSVAAQTVATSYSIGEKEIQHKSVLKLLSQKEMGQTIGHRRDTSSVSLPASCFVDSRICIAYLELLVSKLCRSLTNA